MNNKDFHSVLLEAQKPLLGFALKLTRNETRAKDLLQDANLRILENQKTYNDQKNFINWSFTIMHNLYMDQVRPLKAKAVHVPVELRCWGIGDLNDPSQRLIVQDIEKAVSLLPKKAKRVLELRMVGYSYEEIAEETQSKLGTIKAGIHRARQSIMFLQ